MIRAPARAAALMMETMTFVANSSGATSPDGGEPISAEEVWDFCAHGVVAS